MARKIFAPILATLMVAGLSTGLASPAKADATTKQVIIHYQKIGATTFDDYKNLDMYLWTGLSGDFGPNGNDSYGKSWTFNVDSATTALEGLVKYGWAGDWSNKDGGNNANRAFTLSDTGTTEIWLVSGQTGSTVFSSVADAVANGGATDGALTSTGTDPNFDCDSSNVCMPHIDMPSTQNVIIHYNRPSATGFDSYKGWQIYQFNGGDVWFNGSDAFGKVYTRTLTNAAKTTTFGFIVKTPAWAKDSCSQCAGDGNGDRIIKLDKSGTTEIWVVSGAADAYYTTLADAQAAGAVASTWASGATDPNFTCTDGVCVPASVYPSSETIKIHYNRPAGDYGNWNIWMWGTGTELDNRTVDFTGTDAFGAVAVLPVAGDTSKLAGFGFLLRSQREWSDPTLVKNGGDNQAPVAIASVQEGNTSGAGTVELWIKQGGATNYTSNPFPTPHVGAVAATAKYGQAVTIAGTGLTGASSVTLVRAAVPAVTATKVGNAYKCGSTTRSLGYVCTAAIPAATATAAAHVVSETKIVAAFPNSGAITGKIVVSNPAGTSTSAGNLALSTVKAAPAISSSTAKGVIGDTVTVTGANVGAATSVKLGTLDISDFTVTDTNSLTFTVPAGATDGKISVTTVGGTATAAKAFALVPSISGVTSSVALGGTVTVTGVNLANASAVKLGTKAITVFTKGATSVTFTVPAGSATGTVTVTTPGGAVTSAVSVTVIPAPTGITVSGAKTGTKFNKGATLTITGTNLSGATSVLIGASSVAFTQVDSTHITFTAPAGKTGKVSVVTPGGTGSSAASITTTS